MNLFGSICLSDIPKELIENGTNGKKYITVCIDEKRQVDQWGNTHHVSIYQRRGQDGQYPPKVYLGNLKTSTAGGYGQAPHTNVQPAQPVPAQPAPAYDANDPDNLPF